MNDPAMKRIAEHRARHAQTEILEETVANIKDFRERGVNIDLYQYYDNHAARDELARRKAMAGRGEGQK